MSSRPSLVRSIPFWVLVVGSLASAGAGAAILADKIGVMTTTLTDGSATGLEVYVGQTVAVVGAVLVGAGVVGILLALTVASLATLRPAARIEIVEPIDWTDEVADDEPVIADEPEQLAAADEPVAPGSDPVEAPAQTPSR
ncbi:dinucleotide-utilizing enzyme [Microbacterium sp.]|uniref:dinucleotide-utilizing enzyme n=1 Tax=Microbacterium sp. TaxID=51671 RepID=UPI003F6F1731